MALVEAGILSNARPCLLTLQTLQLFPALKGEADFNGRVPVIFEPDHPRGISDHETGVLKQVSLLHVIYLD
jgi:hypothetical protein